MVEFVPVSFEYYLETSINDYSTVFGFILNLKVELKIRVTCFLSFEFHVARFNLFSGKLINRFFSVT